MIAAKTERLMALVNALETQLRLPRYHVERARVERPPTESSTRSRYLKAW